MAQNYLTRFNHVDRLSSSIKKWQGPVPNLRDIFGREEIDWLLAESIEPEDVYAIIDPRPLVDFVMNSGYKDEPEVEEDRGKRSSTRRTTPIHVAARSTCSRANLLIPELFTIYDRFDVNYSDENGYTHFHVACRHGRIDVVKKFLDNGQDPSLVVPNTGDSALYLALKSGHDEVFELLLSKGANPNSANKDGRTLLHLIGDVDTATMLFELSKWRPVQIDPRDNWGNTPLHLAMRDSNIEMIEFLLRRGADPGAVNDAGSTPLHVTRRNCHNEHKSMETFFEINGELNQAVQVDAKDNLGRTPLQLAVANLYLHNVGVLVNRGAEMSRFVFPTESYYGARYARLIHCAPSIKLEMASGALLAIQVLEAGGEFELQQSHALTVMKFFAKHGLFETSKDLDKYWVNDVDFAVKAKKIMMKPRLSLYDSIQLRIEESAKLLVYQDYYDLANSWTLYTAPKSHKKACIVRLCEIMSRGFFRRWTLDPFAELTNYELPILCCDKILDRLTNQDLYHICLAATSQN